MLDGLVGDGLVQAEVLELAEGEGGLVELVAVLAFGCGLQGLQLPPERGQDIGAMPVPSMVEVGPLLAWWWPLRRCWAQHLLQPGGHGRDDRVTAPSVGVAWHTRPLDRVDDPRRGGHHVPAVRLDVQARGEGVGALLEGSAEVFHEQVVAVRPGDRDGGDRDELGLVLLVQGQEGGQAVAVDVDVDHDQASPSGPDPDVRVRPMPPPCADLVGVGRGVLVAVAAGDDRHLPADSQREDGPALGGVVESGVG